ncbi:hypothetical protein DBR32_07290 [Taibaiella sp. KBW10]|uniref:hypothetical protein n=1 Tax=Taibaiella sp. KBW10 TaxID=2153357 RepID=UPI000F58FEDC|nr:hypothetical protein [Taibaiella sp. KBW10]RQO31742.1 hypothetical protein DBR32_07290 [Taibaiella sp. KBW10]
MKNIWKALYEGNEIKIEQHWFSGEKLYINDILQDNTHQFFSARLTGHLLTLNGARQSIKVNLGGLFQMNCSLYIDDRPIATIQTI